MHLGYSILIQKQISRINLFFAAVIPFSVLVFQIFTKISLLKIKKTLNNEIVLTRTYFSIKKKKLKRQSFHIFKNHSAILILVNNETYNRTSI